MTLASILLIGVLSVSPGAARLAPGLTIEPQSDSANQSTAVAGQAQNSGSAKPGTSGQGTAQAPASAQQPSSSAKKTGKKLKRKKDVSVNCNSPTTQSAGTKTASPNNAADPATRKSASTASSRCPPTKVIVRQGSTTEPSIQVVGGAEGSQASDERNNAIQMLETTEANLKKIEGTQLDSNQQDMIKQVRQFMDQSKAATSSGDLDQARTLAWKAQMLSEELLKK